MVNIKLKLLFKIINLLFIELKDVHKETGQDYTNGCHQGLEMKKQLVVHHQVKSPQRT